MPARVSFETGTESKNDTKIAEVPFRDEAPCAGEAAETHEEGGEYSRQLYD